VSAAKALKAARAAGTELRLDGDDLVLEAAAPPPPVILNLLKAVGSPLFGAFAPPPTPRPCTQPARTKKTGEPQ
jgi:hypothetical protein